MIIKKDIGVKNVGSAHAGTSARLLKQKNKR